MKIASDCQPHIEISYVKRSTKTGIQREMCAYPCLKLATEDKVLNCNGSIS